MGKKTTAEYVIRQSNGYDLGFRRQGETYELVVKLLKHHSDSFGIFTKYAMGSRI